MQPTKTTRIVVLCLALVAVGYGLVRIGLVQGVGTLGVFLLCPLMHVAMMLLMGHGHRSSGSSQAASGGTEPGAGPLPADHCAPRPPAGQAD